MLIEPINARDRPNYFLNHVEHAADVIAKIGKPNIRVQFDFYHVQIVGGDLIRRLEKFLPVIGHLQCAAVPSRHEPDEGEVNYRRCSRRWIGSATADGSAPNIGRVAAQKTAWAGRAPMGVAPPR